MTMFLCVCVVVGEFGETIYMCPIPIYEIMHVPDKLCSMCIDYVY